MSIGSKQKVLNIQDGLSNFYKIKGYLQQIPINEERTAKATLIRVPFL